MAQREYIVMVLGKMKKEIPGLSHEICLEAHGVIDLIGSTFGDVAFDLSNCRVVNFMVNGWLPVQRFF